MIKQWFTFGFGQQYENGYHIVEAEDTNAARDEMCRRFGAQWSFQYDSAELAGVEEYSLHEVKWDGVTFEELEICLMRRINSMCSYREMLIAWRFSKTGNLYFQGKVGKYFGEVMAKKKSELEPGEAVRISKEIGFG